MSETIRARIKRRVRWCAAVAVAGWVIIFATAATHTSGTPPSPLIAVGFALFGGAALASQWAIRCPRCSARLGQEIGMRVGLSLFGKKPNFCPYCGVSLDAPCSPSVVQQTPAQSQNPIK